MKWELMEKNPCTHAASDEEVYNTIYYKEIPVVTGDMDETLIVTYSPKYKDYQRKIRTRQIERAERIITTPGRKRKGKNRSGRKKSDKIEIRVI